MPKTAKLILKMKNDGISGRQNFESQWQTLHDYYDNEGTDVNTTWSPGTELTITQLFDTYSLEVADILAAGLDNYLTPSTSKWFGLRSRDPAKMAKKRVLHYFKDVEDEVYSTLNNSNFTDVKTRFYKKSGVYGTSILFEEEDPFDRVRFSSIPIKNTIIVQDARGRIVEYYIEFDYTATQAVTRFGEKKVHHEVLKRHKEGRDPNKTYKYTLHIAPNWERNPQALDAQNKPYIAQWVDDEHQVIIDTGGFDELPALTHRFYTREETVWGISPAMKALQDVRLLNAKAKTLMRAEMKQVDPPMAMPDNTFLTPYNGNPRGTNYYQRGKLTKDDIFAFGNSGNTTVGMESLEYSKQRIRSQMFTDVFQAFDGITKQMNNPEVFERISEKMTLLGPAVGRFLNVMDDVVHRTISLLHRQGALPEPPPEIKDDPSYETEYLSKLAKAQRNPELQSLQNAMLMVGNMAQFDPSVIDKINPDKGVDVVWDIAGAPVKMLRDDEEVQAIRDNRAQKQAAEQEAALMNQGADTAVKATQAGKNVQEAQNI